MRGKAAVCRVADYSPAPGGLGREPGRLGLGVSSSCADASAGQGHGLEDCLQLEDKLAGLSPCSPPQGPTVQHGEGQRWLHPTAGVPAGVAVGGVFGLKAS